jgi:hypothetical protein
MKRTVVVALLLVAGATGWPLSGHKTISPAPHQEPPKRYAICGIAGPCWVVVGTPIR